MKKKKKIRWSTSNGNLGSESPSGANCIRLFFLFSVCCLLLENVLARGCARKRSLFVLHVVDCAAHKIARALNAPKYHCEPGQECDVFFSLSPRLLAISYALYFQSLLDGNLARTMKATAEWRSRARAAQSSHELLVHRSSSVHIEHPHNPECCCMFWSK